ncbi:C40 family peptidase [Paenibacillus terrigena]|uniref:C40 family peptidase n=1 Tax=Paenibacillus terrigena TaxID=369333 RepID=UPI0003656564|nr:C40 family peptidase [Paenibacillus terrigena]
MKKMLLGLIMCTMAFQMGATTISAASAPVANQTSSNLGQGSNTANLLVDESDPDLPNLEEVSTFAAASSRAVQTAAGAKLATVKNNVNLRVGPSTATRVLRNLPTGEKITILGQANASWYHAQDSSGNIGYLSTAAKYLNITGNAESGRIVARVNLRTQPSTNGSIIKKLESGHVVGILKKADANWLQVWDGEGQVGYISSSSKYIAIGGTVAPTPSSSQVEKVITTGKKYLGVPYEFGSDRNTTKTFDCSDFVRQAYKEALGIVLPSDSRKQGAWVKSNSTAKKSIGSLKRGDLMFFMSYKGSKASDYNGVNKNTERITHVGIYLGNNQILHTYSTKSGGVRIDSIQNTAWEHRFLYGGSVVQ